MSKQLERKLAYSFGILFLIVVIAISIISPPQNSFAQKVFLTTLALAAAGVSAMIPGFIKVKVNTSIRATGAIAVFLVVYFFNPVQNESKIAKLTVGISSVKFDTALTSKYNLSLNEISYKQNSPCETPPRNAIRQPEGVYLLCENTAIPSEKIQYSATIKRATESGYQGNCSDVQPIKLCFTINEKKDKYEAFFDWDEKEKVLTKNTFYDLQWLDFCESKHSDAGWEWIPVLYAANLLKKDSGWIVPALKTLEKNNKSFGTSYTRFKITSNGLTDLVQADSYTYSINVNNTPVYIDGWTKDDTKQTLKGVSGITLEFGLENLDFSGANYGEENICVVFDFYSNNEKIRSKTLNRSYVALRKVDEKTILTEGLEFKWTGDYIIGKEKDGYEVFIWSSTDKEEILERKKRFDRVSRSQNLDNAISVIRPPLKNNKSYGLVIGFTDVTGKIKFTFEKQKAQDILSWVIKDLINKKIAHKQSHIYALKGD